MSSDAIARGSLARLATLNQSSARSQAGSRHRSLVFLLTFASQGICLSKAFMAYRTATFLARFSRPSIEGGTSSFLRFFVFFVSSFLRVFVFVFVCVSRGLRAASAPESLEPLLLGMPLLGPPMSWPIPGRDVACFPAR